MRHPSQPRHRSGLWHFGDPDETSHPGGPLRRWLRFFSGVVYEIGREPDRQTDPWYKTVVIYWAQWPFGIVCLSINIYIQCNSFVYCVNELCIVCIFCILARHRHCHWLQQVTVVDLVDFVWYFFCWESVVWLIVWFGRLTVFVDGLAGLVVDLFWFIYLYFLLLFVKLFCARWEYLARLYNRPWLSIVQL